MPVRHLVILLPRLELKPGLYILSERNDFEPALSAELIVLTQRRTVCLQFYFPGLILQFSVANIAVVLQATSGVGATLSPFNKMAPEWRVAMNLQKFLSL
jgi:hypothetical protein